MTEGIIQKVFSKYIQLHDCECPDIETNQWNELIRTKFIIIQQELIEKIKGESWNLYPSQILDKLIGDNHD